MIKKVTIRIAVFFLATYKFAISQTGDLAKAREEFVKLRSRFEEGPGDILFLMDTTGSISNYGFHSERQFISNFLTTITVTNEVVRVELIPFDSTEVSSYIDQVSNPTSAMEMCTFTEKLKRWQHSYGWMTNTKGAFQLAEKVCLGKRSGNKLGENGRYSHYGWVLDVSLGRPEPCSCRPETASGECGGLCNWYRWS